MRTLRQIIQDNKSDKGLSGDRHNYVAVYECLFRHLRHRPIALLELGVARGYSIQSWLEYFEHGTVVGVDIDITTSAAAISASDDRIKLYQGKAQDPNLVPQQSFDIIIDDGDHLLETQIETLRSHWGNLTDGGLYIIEDLFVGALPWGGRASERTFSLRLPYRGHYGSPSRKYLPHQAQDISFLNRRDLPADICQILDENDYFFPISNISQDGGLNMMMVIYKTSNSGRRMTFHEELSQRWPPPSENVFGRKEDGYGARLAQAKLLSELMNERRPFCFLRMGDMELAYLLVQQGKQLDRIEFEDGSMSGTPAYCYPGLSVKHAERLRRAYEGADYVDFHEKIWPNEHLVPKLTLRRVPGSYRNPTKEASLVLLTWTENEFKQYCRGRRIGFAAAEARLLELLSATPEFKQAAADYWPEEVEIFYHQLRNDGRDLDANLDLVKEDLREFVTKHRLDTLFLSLGGGAKIVGYELSHELGICCFDFGAMIRAFTYSGCDRNLVAPSPHSPFLFRIPFQTHMDALAQVFPNLTAAELLAKAHGQLLLEVTKKEVGWTFPSSEFDFGRENVSAFRRGFRVYRQRYARLFSSCLAAKKERADFLHFCGTHGLTLEGRVFLLLFRLKGFVRHCLVRMLHRDGLKLRFEGQSSSANSDSGH